MSDPTQTQEVVDQFAPVLAGLDPQTSIGLRDSFSDFFAKVKPLIEQAAALPKITDAAQKVEMKVARELRLGLKAIRLDADKKRKELKEGALRYGKAVDGINNVLLFAITPVEKMLQEQEDFIEKQEEYRKAALVETRTADLKPLGVDPKFYQLGEMPEDQYQQLLATHRQAFEAQKAAALKAKQDAEAKAKADAEEREKQRLENERLKDEAKAKDEAAAKERQAAAAEADRLKKVAADAEAATAKANQAEQDAIAARAEQTRQYEAKQKEEREKLEAERAALQAEQHKLELARAAQTKNDTKPAAPVEIKPEGDRTNLALIANSIREFHGSIPSFKTVEGSTIGLNVKNGLLEMANYIEAELQKIPG